MLLMRICSDLSGSPCGAGMCFSSASKTGLMSLPGSSSFQRRGARAARGVEHREVERLVVRAELDEQVEDLVEHFVRAGVRAVDLVDDDDRAKLVLERLLEHEARLRHRPFGRVDEQEHAVRHRQHALDLAAEVGVAGRVDQVDLDRLRR